MNHLLNTIITSDAREIAEQIPDGSIDLIFTDPVYENIEDYRWLAQTALRVLKPDRSCLIWCSGRGQYKVQPIVATWLRFVYPLTYTKIAKAQYLHGFKIFAWTTPCLWFHKGTKLTNEAMIDTVVEYETTIITTTPPPHGTYHWYKGPEAYRKWLRAFTKSLDKPIVYDPFAGSGSLEVECKKLRLDFIASEIKPDIAQLARDRLADTSVMNHVLDPLFQAGMEM
jgi:DNA modification methylase